MLDHTNPTAWSAACRTLAERQPALQAEIDGVAEVLTDTFSSMTKDAIVAYAASNGHELKHDRRTRSGADGDPRLPQGLRREAGA